MKLVSGSTTGLLKLVSGLGYWEWEEACVRKHHWAIERPMGMKLVSGSTTGLLRGLWEWSYMSGSTTGLLRGLWE